MKNRKLLLIVSLVLALTMSLGGTLAYLTDTDSDVNVMTLGNVDIIQLENDEADDGFDQGQPLYPAYYETNWTEATEATGAIKKEVNVKNVGSSDAYIRTVFAIEIGDLTEDEFEKYIHLEWGINTEALEWVDGAVQIEDGKYLIATYTYTAAVEAGDEAGVTLKRVVMDKEANNDVVSKLGNTYEILVVTQAAQTTNLDSLGSAKDALNEAFYEVTATQHPWAGEGDVVPELPTTVASNAAELKTALEKGGKVMLSGDVALNANITIDKDTNINLNGKELKGSFILADGADVTIQNGKINNAAAEVSGVETARGTTLTLNNVTIESARHAVRVDGGEVTINGGTYKITATDGTTQHALNVSNGGKVTINGGIFTGSKGANNDSGAAVNVQANSTVIINGGDFSKGKNDTLASEGTLIIYGGTFDQDPSAYVNTNKATVTKNDNGTWTVAPIPPTKVSSNEDLANAISAGNDVELTADVTYGAAINKDANINLAGNTFEATGTIKLDKNADLTMTGGDYEVNGTFGHVDVRPSTTEGSTVVFENVDFSFNKLNRTNGPSTNRLGSVVEVCAEVADANTDIIFKNCTFDNAQVVFEGLSGKTGTFNATFEKCTFNALTSSAPIYVQNYVRGTITVKDCTFNLEVTSSSASGISISSSTSTSVTLNLEGTNTINANRATPTGSEVTGVDVIKVNGTPANIKMVSIGGTTSTYTNNGTIVATGIAAE